MKNKIEGVILSEERHNELLEFERIVNFAKQHYPNSQNKQEAFLKYVQRALGHSEEDDSRQDDEIEQLKREIDQIKNKLSQLSESNDYLEEKI